MPSTTAKPRTTARIKYETSTSIGAPAGDNSRSIDESSKEHHSSALAEINQRRVSVVVAVLLVLSVLQALSYYSRAPTEVRIQAFNTVVPKVKITASTSSKKAQETASEASKKRLEKRLRKDDTSSNVTSEVALFPTKPPARKLKVPYPIFVASFSKSGTTTEPAIAFRIFKQKLETKYGKQGAKERIFATTDAEKGALNTLAKQQGYEMFDVPDNVGGRFSVLTAVGLLPIAVAGISIQDMLDGAAAARSNYRDTAFESNACLQYVAVRNILHRKGKDIEMLINYEPRLHYLAEWWKQLFGESEGKDQKGIFPASADFSSDLHSLGQYIQDGKRHLFETLLEIGRPETDLTIEANADDLDGLNYLAGKTLDYVNKKAAEGTLMAHYDGGVPNIVLQIPEANAYYLGALFFFFEYACGISGYVLGVNPFDQPGVEAYKKNMFALLGKK